MGSKQNGQKDIDNELDEIKTTKNVEGLNILNALKTKGWTNTFELYW